MSCICSLSALRCAATAVRRAPHASSSASSSPSDTATHKKRKTEAMRLGFRAFAGKKISAQGLSDVRARADKT